MGIRVVSDSSSNVYEVPGMDYRTVPLKVIFGGREYVDRKGTDFEKMVLDLQKFEGPSTTSCPNMHEWLEAFRGADQVIALTISSNLSGSYAAAEMARNYYLAENPEAQVFLLDSMATGPVMHLLIDRIQAGIDAGRSFAEVTEDVLRYRSRMRILYPLASFMNLARNGRVPMAVARIAGALNMRVVGHASEQGTIEIVHKCPGEKRTLKVVVAEMLKRGCTGGPVYIDHCLNPIAARKLKELIEQAIPAARVKVGPCGGLCSYYADYGGLIIGYEGDA